MVRGFFHQPQLAGSCSEFCNHRNFFNADFNDSWDSCGFGTFQGPDALPDLDHEHPDFTHDRSTDHFGCRDVFLLQQDWDSRDPHCSDFGSCGSGNPIRRDHSYRYTERI